MKKVPERAQRALSSLLVFAVIMLIVFLNGENPIVFLIGIGKILLYTAPFYILFWLLEKVGLIDTKAEIKRREKLHKKFKGDKRPAIWIFGGFVAFSIYFILTFYLFSTPKKDDPWVWSMNYEDIKSFYWLFITSYYIFASYVFKIGRKFIKGNKVKLFFHHLASLFTFSIFTIYIFLAYDQPNLIMAMWILTMGVTLAQLVTAHVHRIIESL